MSSHLKNLRDAYSRRAPSRHAIKGARLAGSRTRRSRCARFCQSAAGVLGAASLARASAHDRLSLHGGTSTDVSMFIIARRMTLLIILTDTRAPVSILQPLCRPAAQCAERRRRLAPGRSRQPGAGPRSRIVTPRRFLHRDRADLAGPAGRGGISRRPDEALSEKRRARHVGGRARDEKNSRPRRARRIRASTQHGSGAIIA